MNTSPRARLLVAVAALVAAALTVGVTLVQGRSDHDPGDPPPLELASTSPEIRAAEAAFDRGDRATAREQFEAVLARDPDSVEAAVGAAVAAWPDGTVARLEEIAADHPRSGTARLHLGLALFAQGKRDEAARAWREAERRDPDSPAAIRAEDLLHPDMAPGRPFFFPEGLPPLDESLSPEEQLEALREAGDWLALGVGLQRAGRPVSARAAYDRAVAAEPESLQARVAAAVVRFDKDDPSAAFSRLGPLARDNPDAEVVRYHLGLLLLWIRALDEAEEQLGRAAQGEGTYARQAEALLARLDEIRTPNS